MNFYDSLTFSHPVTVKVRIQRQIFSNAVGHQYLFDPLLSKPKILIPMLYDQASHQQDQCLLWSIQGIMSEKKSFSYCRPVWITVVLTVPAHQSTLNHRCCFGHARDEEQFKLLSSLVVRDYHIIHQVWYTTARLRAFQILRFTQQKLRPPIVFYNYGCVSH